jgi:hypothetical protein
MECLTRKLLIFIYGMTLLAPAQWIGMAVLPYILLCIFLLPTRLLPLRKKLLGISCCSFLLFLAATSFVSYSLAAILILSVVISLAYPLYAAPTVGALVLSTPLFNVGVLLLAQQVPNEIRLAAPFIFACIVSSIFLTGWAYPLFIACSVSIAGALIFTSANIEPLMSGLLCAIPFAVALALYPAEGKKLEKRLTALAVFVVLHCAVLFYVSSPTWERVMVWLPDMENSYESKFFTNYVDTLNMVGVSARQVKNASEVPADSVVLCPWVMGSDAARFLSDLKSLPYSDSLTVIVAGEHTNYLGFLDGVNPILSGAQFNNDTTVPPGNKDSMGAVRTSSLTQFPPSAILNRGASLSLNSLLSNPIIIAEGIFSDRGATPPDPLWVGDYRLMPADSRGWVLLGANFRDGALWSVVGDNSFLLNHIVAAQPEALIRYLSLASNRPALLLALMLLAHGSALMMIPGNRTITIMGCKVDNQLVLLITLFLVSFFFLYATHLTNQKYQISSSYERFRSVWGAFDVRDYSHALVDLAPALTKEKRTALFYAEKTSPSRVGVSGGGEIHVGLLSEGATYPGFEIDTCRRLGAIPLQKRRIYLMDAQACRVRGDIEILIGTESEVVAFSTNSIPRRIFIMDKYFLSGENPHQGNVDFLKSLL